MVYFLEIKCLILFLAIYFSINYSPTNYSVGIDSISDIDIECSQPRPPHAGPPHTSHCMQCDCKYRKGRVVMGSDSRKLPTNCCIFTVDSSHGILDQCIYSDNLINSTVREILLWEKPIFGVAEDKWKTTSPPPPHDVVLPLHRDLALLLRPLPGLHHIILQISIDTV